MSKIIVALMIGVFSLPAFSNGLNKIIDSTRYIDSMFVSYAQNYEDILLYRALSNVSNGFYIDVGAADPTEDSVTKAFYDKGWSGINIDPLPEMHALLEKHRKNDTNINAFISNHKEKEIIFYRGISAPGLSTFDADIVNYHRKNGHSFEKISSKVISLNSLLKNRLEKEIHFLKIDVEGAELDVLNALDFTQHRPWIVVIESTYPTTDISTHKEWEQLLLENNYSFQLFDGLNRYYVRNDKPEIAKKMSVPLTRIKGENMLHNVEYKAFMNIRQDVYNLASHIPLDTPTFLEGWSFDEKTHRWAIGHQSEMILPKLGDNPILKMKCGALINDMQPHTEVNVFIKNQKIATLTFNTTKNDGWREITIPNKLLLKQPLKLIFKSNNPSTALELGINGDKRKLSFWVAEIKPSSA